MLVFSVKDGERPKGTPALSVLVCSKFSLIAVIFCSLWLSSPGGPNHPPNPDQHQQPNQKQVIQQQYVTFRPNSHNYNSPVLKKGMLGNFEPKEPEPQGVPAGPGEGAKPFVLGPEYKDAVQASIKEFGFNMVASDMISLDRSISDIRHEE